MSLYIRHAFLASKLLLRYPSTFPRLVHGISSATAYVSSLMEKDYLNNPVEVKYAEGFYIYLNPLDACYSRFIGITGSWEKEVTQMFKRILSPGSIVIDAGANIGWFTLLAARIVGGGGLVLSFEPDPLNFTFLRKSVERNHLANVRMFQHAVSDLDGTQRLNLSVGGDTGAHSIVREFGGGHVLVQTSRLETIVQNLDVDHIDLVKLDVEGAEPQAISGMRSLIDDGRVLHMIMEWSPQVWARNPELLQMLFRAFRVYLINHLSFRRLTRIGEADLPSSTVNLYLERHV